MTEPLKLAIAGLGTVGAGLIKLLNQNHELIQARTGRDIYPVAVSARTRNKDRGVKLDQFHWFDDPVAMAQSEDIDVYVELIGGENGPALAACEAALSRGIPVVTANKAMLALHGAELAKLAEVNNTSIFFEAAVAGGIPIVKSLRESLSANQISRVYGILNGTCNYILTRMEKEGRPFNEILKEAQEAGYAEADPSFDIGGIDAAHKLALLTALAFGREPNFEDIYIEGIEEIETEDINAAKELGFRIKLLGVAQVTEDGIEQRVHPALVPQRSAIGEVAGVINCVSVDGDFVGNVMLVGPGAGEQATASSVMADIVDIARDERPHTFAMPAKLLKPSRRAPLRAHEGGYYVRLSLYDQPGAFAAVAAQMAKENISLESIVQRKVQNDKVGDESDNEINPVEEKPPASVVMITHKTTELAIRTALQAIEEDGYVHTKPKMIRIERL